MKKHKLNNEGVALIGIIEIVLILVILIGLVVIFKSQISSIVTKAFESITGDAGTIIGR